MFSKDITGSDAFREMPPSSQALYFHLGMEADDDGFLDNYKGLMRAMNASEDDLKILLTKRFIILFPTKVIVVKHWLINNTIRKDRYNETKHLDEKRALVVKENGSYTELSSGKPLVNQLATKRQPSIEENRIEEKSIAAVAAPFSLKEEIKKLEDHPRRDLNIIGFYLKKKGTKLTTTEQFNQALKRHLRAAVSLKPFSDEQITAAASKAARDYPEWTIDTLVKLVTK